eukprot:11622517-Alexandrium_andersonii.AAC.1
MHGVDRGVAQHAAGNIMCEEVVRACARVKDYDACPTRAAKLAYRAMPRVPVAVWCGCRGGGGGAGGPS